MISHIEENHDFSYRGKLYIFGIITANQIRLDMWQKQDVSLKAARSLIRHQKLNVFASYILLNYTGRKFGKSPYYRSPIETGVPSKAITCFKMDWAHKA